MTIHQKLLDIVKTRGAGYLVLLDPDRKSPESLAAFAKTCEAQGADGILIGGSLLLDDGFDRCVEAVKKAVRIPVLLFPGNGRQLSRHADAVLFMSLISGRNPHFLIGEQVTSAPIVRALGLEPVSMAYLLVESGETTAAEFMSGTRPLPRNKPEIAAAHALAAEYLGMKLVYLEAGSGAKHSVPEVLVAAVAKTVSIPVIVGGGIRTPEDAAAKVKAGASFVVTGNVLEKEGGPDLVRSLADAVHGSAVRSAVGNAKPAEPGGSRTGG
jgi:phosphoglycerol geranylgeranyltransferase